MVIGPTDTPTLDWEVIAERFNSLEEALRANKRVERELGADGSVFRWQGVVGSLEVIAEFWVPPPPEAG
jgi:hypothetical protein